MLGLTRHDQRNLKEEPPMGAADVWASLKQYKTQQAAALLVAYGDATKIIATLAGYPGKDKYHGHGTKPGGGDAAIAAAAETNQKAALTYLNQHKPATPPQDKKKSADPVKKANSQAATATLTKIIADNDNLATIRDRLTEEDPNWKNRREVWNAYRLKYKEKKGTEPTK